MRTLRDLVVYFVQKPRDTAEYRRAQRLEVIDDFERVSLIKSDPTSCSEDAREYSSLQDVSKWQIGQVSRTTVQAVYITELHVVKHSFSGDEHIVVRQDNPLWISSRAACVHEGRPFSVGGRCGVSRVLLAESFHESKVEQLEVRLRGRL